MEAGSYYVGDLCYVLHEEWDEVCGLIIKGNNCLDGEFNLKDGRRFACYSTMWGDGLYLDQYGREYGVDAGLIGCILMSDIGFDDDRNFVSGGQVQTFDQSFTTDGGRGERGWDGVIRIGHVVIETDPKDEC